MLSCGHHFSLMVKNKGKSVFLDHIFVVQEKCGWEAWAALQVQVTINTEHGGKPIIFLISFRTGTKLHSLLQKLQVLKEEYRWQSGRKRPEVSFIQNLFGIKCNTWSLEVMANPYFRPTFWCYESRLQTIFASLVSDLNIHLISTLAMYKWTVIFG